MAENSFICSVLCPFCLLFELWLSSNVFLLSSSYLLFCLSLYFFVLPISVDVSANVSTIPLPRGAPSIVRWRSVGFSLRRKLLWQRVFCSVTSLTLKPDKAFICRHVTLSLCTAVFRLFWPKGGCCQSAGDCALLRHSNVTPRCSSPIQRVSCCLQVAAGF